MEVYTAPREARVIGHRQVINESSDLEKYFTFFLKLIVVDGSWDGNKRLKLATLSVYFALRR